MIAWRRNNIWKAVGFLAGLGAFLAAMVVGPALRPDPLGGVPQIELPAMTNVPPPHSRIRLEVAGTSGMQTRSGASS